MPLSEHEAHKVRRMWYMRADGIERQEQLQYLRQIWKSAIWSEENDELYTLPDPEVPLVYSLNYTQQCPPDWDVSTLPAETVDPRKED